MRNSRIRCVAASPEESGRRAAIRFRDRDGSAKRPENCGATAIRTVLVALFITSALSVGRTLPAQELRGDDSGVGSREVRELCKKWWGDPDVAILYARPVYVSERTLHGGGQWIHFDIRKVVKPVRIVGDRFFLPMGARDPSGEPGTRIVEGGRYLFAVRVGSHLYYLTNLVGIVDLGTADELALSDLIQSVRAESGLGRLPCCVDPFLGRAFKQTPWNREWIVATSVDGSRNPRDHGFTPERVQECIRTKGSIVVVRAAYPPPSLSNGSPANSAHECRVLEWLTSPAEPVTTLKVDDRAYRRLVNGLPAQSPVEGERPSMIYGPYCFAMMVSGGGDSRQLSALMTLTASDDLAIDEIRKTVTEAQRIAAEVK